MQPIERNHVGFIPFFFFFQNCACSWSTMQLNLHDINQKPRCVKLVMAILESQQQHSWAPLILVVLNQHWLKHAMKQWHEQNDGHFSLYVTQPWLLAISVAVIRVYNQVTLPVNSPLASSYLPSTKPPPSAPLTLAPSSPCLPALSEREFTLRWMLTSQRMREGQMLRCCCDPLRQSGIWLRTF